MSDAMPSPQDLVDGLVIVPSTPEQDEELAERMRRTAAMTPDDVDETGYLMSSRENARRLTDAIERLSNGEGVERELAEPDTEPLP